MHEINDHLIINKHSEYLEINFKLIVRQENKALRSIYWILKLHKNSRNARSLILIRLSLIFSISNILVEAID